MPDVQFKTVKHEDGTEQEICEIRLNEGTVAAFPADETPRGRYRTYREKYSTEYDRFKNRGKKTEPAIGPFGDAYPRKATVTGPTVDNTVKKTRTRKRK